MQNRWPIRVIVTESGRATRRPHHHAVLQHHRCHALLPLKPAAGTADRCPTRCSRRQFQLYRQAETFELTTGCRQTIQIRDEIRELFRQERNRSAPALDGRKSVPGDCRVLSAAVLISWTSLRRNWNSCEPAWPISTTVISASFSRVPDTWAIGQLFPVMPIHRLGEYPEHRATISDLTCDCDGNLDRFIIGSGESPTLPLHGLKQGEDYILGVFMMGAYQETLGDLHKPVRRYQRPSVSNSAKGEALTSFASSQPIRCSMFWKCSSTTGPPSSTASAAVSKVPFVADGST